MVISKIHVEYTVRPVCVLWFCVLGWPSLFFSLLFFVVHEGISRHLSQYGNFERIRLQK